MNVRTKMTKKIVMIKKPFTAEVFSTDIALFKSAVLENFAPQKMRRNCKISAIIIKFLKCCIVD